VSYHTQSVAPTIRPVSLDEIRADRRVTEHDEDGLLLDCLDAAVDYVEKVTGRQLCTATWVRTLDAWPSGDVIALRPPVASVTSVQYVDSNGTTQTLSTDVYEVSTGADRVQLKYNQVWPVARAQFDAITVTYTAGAAAASVPATLKRAVLYLAGHYYENREPVSFGATPADVALTVNSLIAVDQEAAF